MPFENGSFSFTAFRLPKELPEDAEIVASLQDHAAQKLDNLGEEEQVGWVSWRYLLENELDESNVMLGRFPFFTLRTASRKVPSALLKAECRMRELQYIHEHQLNRIPSKKRKEIREDIVRIRLSQMPPAIAGVQVAIDRPNRICWFGSASGKMQKLFMELFRKTFGFEPEPVSLSEVLFRQLKKMPSEMIPLTYGDCTQADIDFPGRDFLTWLWHFSETTLGGEISVDRGAPAGIAVDGPLTLIATAEGKGAGETCIRKGLPTKSAEVKAALSVGKKLRKAKLMMQKEEAWNFSFDADKFAFSGVILPEGDSMAEAERFDDRMERTFILFKVMEAYFTEFAKIMTNQGAALGLQSDINQWIEAREGF